MRQLTAFASLGILLQTLISPVAAEPPSASYVFPAGGQRGTKVDIKVGGLYLHEGCPFDMIGEGVKAPARVERTRTIWFEGPVIPMPASQGKEDYPKDYAGSVGIAAGATLGSRYWRVSTSQGVTPLRKFVVGDLKEIVEEELDGDPIPVEVQLPVTINGRIFPREDVDVWTFQAKAGETISCEVNASRIGSALDSRLEIRGPDGLMIVQNVDTFGADSFVQFTAPKAGVYQCRIHDINFSGLQHFVYRLTIRNGAFIRSVYPMGGKRGAQVQFSLSGTQTPTESIAMQIGENAGPFIRHQFAVAGGNSNPVLLETGDAPESLEEEPNDSAEAEQATQKFSAPATVNGRILESGDVDLWKFTAEKGQSLQFEVHAALLGSSLDSVIAILSSDGKQLASNDDAGGGNPDSRLNWTVPDGEFWYLQIKDQLATRGGPDFGYRIHVRPAPTQDFALTLPADFVIVNRAAEAKVKVTVNRSLGWKGEIELAVKGLPEGVTVEGTKIAKNKNDTQLVIKAAETAKIDVSSLRVVGSAVESETEIKRTARLSVKPGDPPIEELALAVSIPTPFKFFSPFETKYASRGTVYGRHYQIERGDYKGPIEIEFADSQARHLQGVTGPKIIVPPGESEFDYSITLPPWMEIGRTSRTCLMASGFVTDESGKKHRVSFTSHGQDDQIICLVDPVRLSVDTPHKAIRFRSDTKFRIPIRVGRGPGLSGPVNVGLVVPPHIRGCKAVSIVVSADAKSALMELQFEAANAGPFNMPLLLRAEMMDERGLPVTAECPIVVRHLAE